MRTQEVKQKRIGIQWGLKSIKLPAGEMTPGYDGVFALEPSIARKGIRGSRARKMTYNTKKT